MEQVLESVVQQDRELERRLDRKRQPAAAENLPERRRRVLTERPEAKRPESHTYSNAPVKDADIKSFARRRPIRASFGSTSNVPSATIANSSAWDQEICQRLNWMFQLQPRPSTSTTLVLSVSAQTSLGY